VTLLTLAGAARGRLTVPQIPGLIGIKVYHAAVSYNKAGLTDASNTGVSTITK